MVWKRGSGGALDCERADDGARPKRNRKSNPSGLFMESYTWRGWDCSRGRARAVAVIRVLRLPYTVALELDDYFAHGARLDLRVCRRDGGR